MLSVVVPTFNEGKNIRNLVTQIDEALKGIDYEILFVDDSKDDTPQIIMEVAKDFPAVRMEHRTGESGLATAVLKGFRLAKGEYMACMDADLQHPPIVLKYMYKAMEAGADFCIPSRLIPGGDDGGLNWYRKFVSGTARKIGQIMLPCLRQISDPTSGLFMFRREVIEHADLQPIGWKIMVEVLAMGTYSKVIEIPYKFQQRTEGESKLSGKVTMEYLKQLKDLRKRYNKANKYKVEIWSEDKIEYVLVNAKRVQIEKDVVGHDFVEISLKKKKTSIEVKTKHRKVLKKEEIKRSAVRITSIQKIRMWLKQIFKL